MAVREDVHLGRPVAGCQGPEMVTVPLVTVMTVPAGSVWWSADVWPYALPSPIDLSHAAICDGSSPAATACTKVDGGGGVRFGLRRWRGRAGATVVGGGGIGAGAATVVGALVAVVLRGGAVVGGVVGFGAAVGGATALVSAAAAVRGVEMAAGIERLFGNGQLPPARPIPAWAQSGKH